MSELSYDYLIIGQGIAGSILSMELIGKGRKVLVIDRYNPNASSVVAAGLVNPITGRRVVKSWMAETVIPFAHEYYRKQEEKFGRKFYSHLDSLEVITGIKELNDWTGRMADESISQYFRNSAQDERIYKGKIRDFKKLIRISDSGWMNIPLFLNAVRNFLRSEKAILEESFEQSQLRIGKFIEYGKVTSSRVVFCEGYAGCKNELWKFIPFVPAKGEILTIKCEELPQEHILLCGIFLVPLGDHLFRVGSTYEWNFKDEAPSAEGRTKLIHELDNFLKLPYEITAHHAGVRPTMKDRRPVIGSHPGHDNVYIFNGLGTKGVVLAPYFAHMLTDHLLNGNSIMDEVNVLRFS